LIHEGIINSKLREKAPENLRVLKKQRERERESALGLREKEGFAHGRATPSTTMIEFFFILMSFGRFRRRGLVAIVLLDLSLGNTEFFSSW
jgi:hypothetical protein